MPDALVETTKVFVGERTTPVGVCLADGALGIPGPETFTRGQEAAVRALEVARRLPVVGRLLVGAFDFTWLLHN